MSSFTACVITGSVMMNMISNTNMTSISGVVLMSIMGSPSPPPPTLIAMANYPVCICVGRSLAAGALAAPGSVMNPTF